MTQGLIFYSLSRGLFFELKMLFTKTASIVFDKIRASRTGSSKLPFWNLISFSSRTGSRAKFWVGGRITTANTFIHDVNISIIIGTTKFFNNYFSSSIPIGTTNNLKQQL
jgi:hypothetical protein